MRFIPIGVLLLAAVPPAAWADLPLTIEDIITDKGKVKLDLSVSYANADRQGVSTADPITVQTGPTSFVTLPTLIGESVGNSDTTVATLGLRYGLTAKTEIYARLSGLASGQRSSGLGGSAKSSESGFADAWAGINYQFKKDDDTPAVLGFAEIALREKHRSSSSTSFKSALLGVTTYKAIDPVVFSLTTASRFNQSRQDGAQRYKPGNLLLLNPSVAFAVNDRVTLTTGVQWTRRAAGRYNGQTQGIARTATDLLLGVGYGFAKDNTLNTTFKMNASGRSGAELRVNWLYTF
ncbi:hypothetical protein D8B23_10525 [Verminephrobacter aporrectodeae subsp. tuberculatae]|uniref:hypothetical protein n=1 Tax=Verminephrobacter aporrectodeae TaxID=1110389 RepID=UPI002244EAF5|nr:hypothetical protein [Verminephrobacter aporrectodeae]MCW8198848.1 hypothetical protein [Verminephrobacter aporrectodeae subsp. tuberculatae]